MQNNFVVNSYHFKTAQSIQFFRYLFYIPVFKLYFTYFFINCFLWCSFLPSLFSFCFSRFFVTVFSFILYTFFFCFFFFLPSFFSVNKYFIYILYIFFIYVVCYLFRKQIITCKEKYKKHNHIFLKTYFIPFTLEQHFSILPF